jgi:branched-chain amino acid transport system permease protein
MSNFLAFTVVGIVTGCVYAVVASGLVVTYTTSGIFNFAHGAIGMFMAFLYWELKVHQGWPTIPALVVVLFVCAPLMGAIIERVFIRKLHGAPTGVSLVVTLALLVILLGIAQTIWKPGKGRILPSFFAGHTVRIAGVVVSYHRLTVVATAALIAVLLRLLLFHTRVGVTMRAVVDSPELSGLNGVYPERIAQLSWAMGAMLAALAGILIAPDLGLDHLILTLLVVNGYAAAILGRLRNLPLTFVGALILGLLENYAIGYSGSWKLIGLMKPVLPTIFLFAILVFLPQARLRAGRIVGMRTPRVPGLRESLIRGGILIAVVALVSTQMSEYWTFNTSSAFVLGIVMLSLVVLSGYAGQISLMQITFLGVGAITMGHVAGGTLLGLVAAAVIAAAFGALVAIPALRLQDLYLALTTLAFAVFGQWFVERGYLMNRGGILPVKRLHLPGIAFRSEQAQLILTAVAFTAIAIGVLSLRRSAFGRRMAAMRDSPMACTTLGLNLLSTKTAVFAISGGIAGIAGALFGGVRTGISGGDFPWLLSLFVFLVASFGGLTTVTGALFAGSFLTLIPELNKLIHVSNLQNYGIGLGAIALADNPNGFGGNLAMLGDLIRRRRGSTTAAADTAPEPGAELVAEREVAVT